MMVRQQSTTSTTSVRRDSTTQSSLTFTSQLNRVISRSGKGRALPTDSQRLNTKGSLRKTVAASDQPFKSGSSNTLTSKQGTLWTQGQSAVSNNWDTELPLTNIVTGNIEFANVSRPKSMMIKQAQRVSAISTQALFKLIDFGAAVGIHEPEDEGVHEHDTMMTFTELEFAGYLLFKESNTSLLETCYDLGVIDN